MKFRGVYQRYMFRPFIYMAARRLMLGGIFLLAVVRFVPRGPSPDMAAGFLAALFALFAYLVYLRMDGLRIPRMKFLKPKKKDPLRNFGDMTDHVDDEPQVTFDELEEDEKNLCSLLSNLVCLAVFLAISFIR